MQSRVSTRLAGWAPPLLAVGLCAAFWGCDRSEPKHLAAVPDTGPASPALSVSEAAALESVSATADGDPALGAAGQFFPLEQGNRWSYQRHVDSQVLPDAGDPPPPDRFESTIDSEIDGTDEQFGRTYVVLNRHWTEEADSFDQWIRFRQDPAGLYEADVMVGEPPAAPPAGGAPMPPMQLAGAGGPAGGASGSGALRDPVVARARARLAAAGLDVAWLRALDRLAGRRGLLLGAVTRPASGAASSAAELGHRRRGGVLEQELLRLAYPLRRGASWSVLAGEPDVLIWTVEGSELITTPAGAFVAWRIRVDGSPFGPQDQAHFWYGRCGELRMVAHLVSEATDENGNRIGTLVWDERSELTDIALSRRACR